MREELDAARRTLAVLKGVLAKRPDKDDHALAIATRGLCAWRDSLIDRSGPSGADRDRLQRINAVLSVVVGLQYPTGETPWEAFEAAVKDVERLIGTIPA